MSLEELATASKAPTVEEVAAAIVAIAAAHGKPMVSTGEKTTSDHAKRLIRRVCAHLHKGTQLSVYLLAFDAAESVQMLMTGYAEEHADGIEDLSETMAAAHDKMLEDLDAAVASLRDPS